jgi:hypothetical protein
VLMHERLRGERGREAVRTLAAHLHCLHARGMAHSAVAPSSVIRLDGEWKLIDLAAATALGEMVRRRPPTRPSNAAVSLRAIDGLAAARRCAVCGGEGMAHHHFCGDTFWAAAWTHNSALSRCNHPPSTQQGTNRSCAGASATFSVP